MKTNYLSLIGTILLCCVFAFSGSAQTKTAYVGLITNGQIAISDQEQALIVLKGSLPTNAVLNNVSIRFEEQLQHYYLTAEVSNDAIRYIAILLTKKGATLYLMNGPGYEILCMGSNNCNNCISKTSDGHDVCACNGDLAKTGDCKMVTRNTINF